MTISSGGPFYYNVYFVKYSDCVKEDMLDPWIRDGDH